MAVMIFLFLAVFLLVRLFLKQDGESRVRFKFIYNFICLYEKETGIRLTTDQAIALIQVTLVTMSRSPRDKVYLDAGYPNAQRMVDKLCAEAERTAYNRF
jgi:hypothetical protein